MLSRNKILREKRAAGSEFSIEKVIILLLAILVLVAIIVFITKPQILDWIRNQPGYNPPADNESEMTCDQLKTLGYDRIARVVYDERSGDFGKHYYIDFINEKEIIPSDCNSYVGTKKEACIVSDCPDFSILKKEDC